MSIRPIREVPAEVAEFGSSILNPELREEVWIAGLENFLLDSVIVGPPQRCSLHLDRIGGPAKPAASRPKMVFGFRALQLQRLNSGMS